MQSAFQMGHSQGKRILLVGSGGVGKTTQGLTLPRPILFIFFDPAGPEALAAHPEAIANPTDVMWEAFPFLDEAVEKPPKDALPYSKFRKWWDEGIKTKAFERFNTIVLDSLTMLGDAAMEPVLHTNQRWGMFPHQDDYGPQMTNVMAALRPLISFARRGKVVLVTAHDELRDNERGTMVYQIMVTGKLREKLPLLFGERFRCETVEEKDTKGVTHTRYVMRTRPTGLYPGVRTSLKLENPQDITIGDFSRPEDFGLGRLLKDKWGTGGDVPSATPSVAGPKPAVEQGKEPNVA